MTGLNRIRAAICTDEWVMERRMFEAMAAARAIFYVSRPMGIDCQVGDGDANG